MAPKAPLSVLPLTSILRSLMTATVSSSPVLLPPSLRVMSLLAHTTSPVLNPDKNPLLKLVLKKTFYAQFCAGENAAEVQATIEGLKKVGFRGVILGYAREVVMSKEESALIGSSAASAKAAAKAAAPDGSYTSADKTITPATAADVTNVKNPDIDAWLSGTLETVRLASASDFVALKFTGAGSAALAALTHNLPPPPQLKSAIDAICEAASARGVRLLFDAEQTAVQKGIDAWTMDYQRRFNTPQKATVYGTYQAYLKATPSVLSAHLATASNEGFTLGVKLVRGAYLGSDPRHLIHDTKADTDAAYDGIAESLLTGRWEGPLAPPKGEKNVRFPNVDTVLASHNRDSVLKARSILSSLPAGAKKQPEVSFAQLQGMADEVSCELLTPSSSNGVERHRKLDKVAAYKYLVWGSTGECMKYLLRRAQENRDAVQRTKSGKEAMKAELVRRVKAFFGLA